jgi:hypothetical protein
VQLTWPRPNRSLGFVDALALTGLLGFLVARFIPVAKLPFWGCTLRSTTGWPCPGCGLTRVAEGIARGELLAAWEANPLATVAALGFVVAITLSALHLVFALPLPQLRLEAREASWARRAVVALVVVNYAWVVLRVRFPDVLASL